MSIRRIKLRYVILFAGWTIYVLSLFLPASLFITDKIIVWQLIELAFLRLWDESHDIRFIYWTIFLMNNLSMFFSPLFIFYVKGRKILLPYKIYMVLATVFNCLLTILESHLIIGYHLWCLSFFLVTAALFMKSKEPT